jgi:hypothetical protein
MFGALMAGEMPSQVLQLSVFVFRNFQRRTIFQLAHHLGSRVQILFGLFRINEEWWARIRPVRLESKLDLDGRPRIRFHPALPEMRLHRRSDHGFVWFDRERGHSATLVFSSQTESSCARWLIPHAFIHFFTYQTGNRFPFFGKRTVRALRSEARSFKNKLGPDRLLELLAIRDCHHKSVRTSDHAVLKVEVEILDIFLHLRVGWLLQHHR